MGSSNKKKQCVQNTCVGEQCDIRGCDCDEDSYSYLEKQIYISIYLFKNNTDISLVGGLSIINIQKLM